MLTGTVKKIKLIEGHEVYTRTVGSGKTPILLLHGGPGACHECFEIMEAYLDLENYSLIYYDQLGSYYSDRIHDDSLLTLERYVDEVEQVRNALGLDQFIVLGHSWGAVLGLEYALKYQQSSHLKALIISNMTASGKSYREGVEKRRSELLSPEQLKYMKRIESQKRYSDTHYQSIIQEVLNPQSFFRGKELPGFMLPEKLAYNVYSKFQGDNEFILTGTLKSWNRWDSLEKISIRSLLIGAMNDTISIEDILEMKLRIPGANMLVCPEGSHFAFLDDTEYYFTGLNSFLQTL